MRRAPAAPERGLMVNVISRDRSVSCGTKSRPDAGNRLTNVSAGRRATDELARRPAAAAAYGVDIPAMSLTQCPFGRVCPAPRRAGAESGIRSQLAGAADSRAGARVGLWPLWHHWYQALTRPNDVDATSMLLERRGCGIHALSAGGGRVSPVTAACRGRSNTRRHARGSPPPAVMNGRWARITGHGSPPEGWEPGAGSVGFLVVRPERAQRHLEGVQPAADDLRLPRVGATRSPFGAHRRADCLQ